MVTVSDPDVSNVEGLGVPFQVGLDYYWSTILIVEVHVVISLHADLSHILEVPFNFEKSVVLHSFEENFHYAIKISCITVRIIQGRGMRNRINYFQNLALKIHHQVAENKPSKVEVN